MPIIMPALYAPIIVMLLALVFRGVAFEFRWRTKRGKFLWDWAFAGGSLVAAFAQGVALGAFVQGIPVAGRAYARRLVGLADACSASSRRWRSSWAMRSSAPPGSSTRPRARPASKRAYRVALLAVATLVLIGRVSLWTPFLEPLYMERWFSWPQIVLHRAGAALRGWRGRTPLHVAPANREELTPFLSRRWRSSSSPYAGIGISFYPYHRAADAVTIWDAAAPR